MNLTNCKHCGGQVGDGKQKYHHQRRCQGYREEGVDHIRCLVCGFRATSLSRHLSLHGLDSTAYREKYPDAPVVMSHIVEARNRSNIGTHVKPISKKRGAKQCKVCSEWYQPETSKKHLQDCVAAHPEAYTKDVDYVACPECGVALLRLGAHLKKEHGWTADKLQIEKNRGLKLIAEVVARKWREGQDFEKAQKKREATHLERHGHVNPFADPEVKERLVATSRRRYGVDHPMKDEEIFIRNREANGVRPTHLEWFFDTHTPDCVVYSGYGARFLRTKTGVRKCGRVFRDLNPDFMVMPERLVVKAKGLSEGMEPFPKHWKVGRVVELLGQWWHSEEVIGIPEKVHCEELIGAYNSIGIECLVLWEEEVLHRWDETEGRVKEWLMSV